jgi:hypothetical protein
MNNGLDLIRDIAVENTRDRAAGRILELSKEIVPYVTQPNPGIPNYSRKKIWDKEIEGEDCVYYVELHYNGGAKLTNDLVNNSALYLRKYDGKRPTGELLQESIFMVTNRKGFKGENGRNIRFIQYREGSDIILFHTQGYWTGSPNQLTAYEGTEKLLEEITAII